MIALHHACTRGSSASKLTIAHFCKPTRHTSFAAPDTGDKHKFYLTHFIHFSNLTNGLTFTNKPFDSQPFFDISEVIITVLTRCGSFVFELKKTVTPAISHRGYFMELIFNCN